MAKTHFPTCEIKIKVNNEHNSHGAEYMGIGKSHFIAIYESLMLKLNHEEIIAVLAHEIGHWHHRHSFKSLVVNLVQNMSIFYIYSFFVHNEGISLSFGFKYKSVHVPIYRSLWARRSSINC
jgi:STE24 endopeptidase